MQSVYVQNLPPIGWFYVLIAVTILLFVLVGIIFWLLRQQIAGIMRDINDMTTEINRALPKLLGAVDDTMANVKTMSDDVQVTTHNVTGAANRVAHVLGLVVGKLESPLVKSVGVLSGLAAGLGALRGKKKEADGDSKKKKGFFNRG